MMLVWLRGFQPTFGSGTKKAFAQGQKRSAVPIGHKSEEANTNKAFGKRV